MAVTAGTVTVIQRGVAEEEATEEVGNGDVRSRR